MQYNSTEHKRNNHFLLGNTLDSHKQNTIDNYFTPLKLSAMQWDKPQSKLNTTNKWLKKWQSQISVLRQNPYNCVTNGYLYMQDIVQRRVMTITKIPTTHNPANALTKRLPSTTINSHLDRLCLQNDISSWFTSRRSYND
eukprot:2633531-Amphidinium_carterae.5